LAYRQKIVNETLKNIVMHIVPTTRKAYVDDIVNGIRTLMSGDELTKINAPVDLPENVLRFVQKRYNNLLLEESYANTVQPSITAKASTTGTSQVHVECDQSMTGSTGVLPVKITVTMSPKQQKPPQQEPTSMSENNLSNSLNNHDIETDVTVVKEIRKEMLSNGQDNTPSMSNMNEEIMKVDEETLYIVEKRKQPNSDSSLSSSAPSTSVSSTTTTNVLPSMSQSVSTNPITGPTTTQSTHFVEKEIRKNFELKPKETQEPTVVTVTTAPKAEQKQQQQQQPKQQQSNSSHSSNNSNSTNFYDEFNK
jgi:hypothetical protein